MEERVNVVRNQKDTIFRMLFREKKELLVLYNALNATNYQDPEELEIYTLENAIYMAVKNDVSFLLESELNLYEHQASYNPNMPLRDLIYIAKQLEKYIVKKSLYSSSITKIPVPRFVVFYNGSEKQPERQLLKLSDAFEKQVEEPELELKVLMLNINPGNNSELLERCRTLRDYCEYVSCVRKYAGAESIEEAVEHAVTECIQKGILADFLNRQRAEVKAMSIFEYNEEEERRKFRDAERADAREKGWMEGNAAGIAAGMAEGMAQGMAEGMATGRTEGIAMSVLFLLERIGEVTPCLRNRITQEQNIDTLRRWLELAAESQSIEDFEKNIS